MNIYPILRTLLFRLDTEHAHHLTLRLISWAGNNNPVNRLLYQVYKAPQKPVQVFGLSFPNLIGLAAGYDKDGLAWRGLACLGFGHVEVGTVTPKAQPGNPKPRLFRIASQQALINRMGFPGLGAEFVRKQVSKPKLGEMILGVNIGKNKDTPLEAADQDYVSLLHTFGPLADYLAVNISSPNTVGLRRLQEKQALNHLLSQLRSERKKIATSQRNLPLLVKLAPDLSDSELDEALQAILDNGMDGVIATNTTISRNGLNSPLAGETGGLSGPPLFARSLDMVGKIIQRTNGSLPVIGVGGIHNATGVQKMLDAGAVLVQLYTGLIYEGPGLVKKILRDLSRS